jgi:hypothetical protein
MMPALHLSPSVMSVRIIYSLSWSRVSSVGEFSETLHVELTGNCCGERAMNKDRGADVDGGNLI